MLHNKRKKPINFEIISHCLSPLQWLSGKAFASSAGDRGSIPGHDIPKSLKTGSDNFNTNNAKRSGRGASIRSPRR